MKTKKILLMIILTCVFVLCAVGLVGCQGDEHTFINGYCIDCKMHKTSKGVKYLLNNDGKSYSLHGVGDFAGGELIVNYYNGLPVTAVGSLNTDRLTSITLGNNVKIIYHSAFKNCKNLTTVKMSNNVEEIQEYAFYGCTKLSTIDIPNSVKEIGDYAFEGCIKLRTIDIPNSVKEIGDDAFYGCYGLYRVTIGKNVQKIDSSAFKNCYNLVEVINHSPNYTITQGSEECGYLGQNALFVYNGKKTPKSKIVIENGYIIYPHEQDKILVGYSGDGSDLFVPSHVTKINKYIFSGNQNLKSIVIGNKVTSIAERAFNSCTNLRSVILPNSLERIGDYAFSGCKNLFSIVVPQNVKTIGDYAFLGCERLVEVINYSDNFEVFKASEENGKVGSYAIWVYNGSETQQSRVSNDDGYIIYTDGNEKVLVGYVGNQKEMVVPDYVTQINTRAFMDDTNLTRVTMGDNLHTIQRHAFTGCKNLTSVTVGRGLKLVGFQAFDRCEKISAVHYYGTESDWKNIAIGDYNQKFENAPRFYH